MKRVLLIVAAAVAFLIGYGGATKAWPGVPDRTRWQGYFQNQYDDKGGFVLPSGIPSYVDTPAELIGYIRSMLASGNPRERVGASFLVQTMLGNPWNRHDPPTNEQMADWESRIYYAHSASWIQWSMSFNYNYNSYWQGTDTGMNWNDDAFYYESGWATSIRFLNVSGQTAYVIRRECANPIGDTTMPGLQQYWDIAGSTGAVPTTAQPGQTVAFNHYLWNMGTTGPVVADATLDGPSSVPTGLSTNNGSVYIGPGWTVNPINESFRIPDNAAPGSRYCRLVAWDPINSWGGRGGRGAEACVTVTISAKLKAAMSATPKPIQAGDTITFTPAISATTNASPIVVNCSITRTLIPPSGGSSNLGAQPCVDSSGNANITIPPGGSVTLRANTYVSASSIAVGSRVCDTITITNPSGAGFYTVPADQSSQDCSTVAKAPYVQFTGGDVWAGGGFAAVAPGMCNTSAKITTITRSRTVADGTTPGSGVTYAAFALGKITNFGSGSVANVSATGAGDNWTFSNINSGNLGFFGVAQHCIPDYVATYQSSPTLAPGSIDIGCLNATCGGGGSGAWRFTGSTTLHGTLGVGLRKVYLVSGDVTIDADIRYPVTYTGPTQIPSLVVIATGNIYVNSPVQQIDGIYIARGTVYTCYPKVEPATITTCPNRLTVNGSISSTGLDLFRTAGADGATPATQKSAAEVFNLSPEVFLTNALNQTTQTTVTTNNVRELPPRF